MDFINLAADSPFHPLVWIGVGKRFSHSLPPEVLDEKQRILEIPETFCNRLPPSIISVQNFLDWNLPPQSGNVDIHVTAEWFSNDGPRTDPNVLITRPIPPPEVLGTLDAALGQKWLDGNHSIIDPRFNDGAERFPLWALSLWKEVEKLIQCQGKWRRSVRWLELMAHPAEIVARANDIVGRISWNKPLRSRGATSLDLTGFLSVSWLSDTQIDMMIDTLQERMKDEKHAEGTIVAPVAFAHEIVSVAGGMKKTTSKYLSRVADQVRETRAKILWFPIYVNTSHWITGRVDFERRTFAFGECHVQHR